ncbi:MAG: Gfo/Idh/MocA family oxidoreductase [Sedimentisphaerales bacterium]|nr:Gfo/Idh/MocA family oxidoreductase [Sedimentisphaerales bacterium]
MKIWNVGIIGAGLIADFHARALAEIPNARLTGVCDTIPARATTLARTHNCQAYDSFDALLNNKDIDIITIATPSGTHMEPAIAAARAGKHVLCEKPLEITLERMDAMIQAHQESGTILGGIFQYRFDDCISLIRQAIHSGRFGKITYAGVAVPWWRTDEYYHNSWHGTWKLDGGGALMNQSIHMIDILCHLMGPVTSIQAFTGTLGHTKDIETEDTAVAILRFAGGALGSIYGTTASFPGRHRQLEITGTAGTVICVEDTITCWEFADKQPQDMEIQRRFSGDSSRGGTADPAAINCQNHIRNFRSFLKALEEDREFELNGRQARKAVEVILSIYKSAQEQMVVNLL